MERLKKFMLRKHSGYGTPQVILILVILIGITLLFKDPITALLNGF